MQKLEENVYKECIFKFYKLNVFINCFTFFFVFLCFFFSLSVLNRKYYININLWKTFILKYKIKNADKPISMCFTI